MRGSVTLRRAMTLDGILPEHVPANASPQITATLPDGHVEPLLWLYQYRSQFRHPFMFRVPVQLPAGTRIGGVQPPLVVRLLESR